MVQQVEGCFGFLKKHWFTVLKKKNFHQPAELSEFKQDFLFYLPKFNALYSQSFWFSLQGLKFEILKSNFEENLDKSSFKSPVDYVKETAKQKTIEVASILADKPVKLMYMHLIT